MKRLLAAWAMSRTSLGYGEYKTVWVWVPLQHCSAHCAALAHLTACPADTGRPARLSFSPQPAPALHPPHCNKYHREKLLIAPLKGIINEPVRNNPNTHQPHHRSETNPTASYRSTKLRHISTHNFSEIPARLRIIPKMSETCQLTLV